MRVFAALSLVVFSACPEVPAARNCDIRQAYYPDANGDGFGEHTAVYIGCDAPDGWVAVLETGDTDTDPLGDTDVPDTDGSETDTPDTDAP